MTDHLSPHWDRAALLVIDVQHDFLDGGTATVPGTSTVLPALEGLVAAFRRSGRPIVHVIRLYEPGGSDVDLPRRAAVEAGARLVAPGTPGAAIPSGLLPGPVSLDEASLLSGRPQVVGPREVVFFKPRWSAFHRTSLEVWLRSAGCDTVVVAGCNLPNCPRATLFDASERDLRTVLAEDAVSQVTEERLADLRLIGVGTYQVDQIARALAVVGPADEPTGT